MNHHKRVAEIFSNNYHCGGTGYLIQDDLLLTAYHVACPEKNLSSAHDEQYDIRFIGDFAEGRTEWLNAEAILCWYSKDHDLALLKLKSGKPIFLVESDSKIKFGKLEGDTLLAKGNGFPKVQTIENRQNPEPIEGKLSWLAGIKLKQLRLQVTSLVPETPEEWAGISGTALFVGEYLVGIVTDTNKSFGEKALWATPISLIANNREFCKLVLNDPTRNSIDLTELTDLELREGVVINTEDKPKEDKPKYADKLAINSEQDLKELVEFVKLTTIDQNKNSIDLIDFINEIPKKNSRSNNTLISLFLKGQQGSGKSTFLSVLYSILNSEYSPRFNQLFPLYINLSNYIYAIDQDESIRTKLKEIESVLSKRNSYQYVLMVDGLSTREKYLSESLSNRIIDNISFRKIDAIIWSISDDFDRNIKKIVKSKQKFPPYIEKYINIKTIETNNPEIDVFLSLFIVLYNKAQGILLNEFELKNKVKSLKTQLDKLNITEADQYILSIIYHRLDNDGYREILSKAHYLQCFCQDKFKFKEPEKLEYPAFLAYKAVVESFYSDPSIKPPEGLCINNEDRNSEHWEFIIENNIIRDFLASWYVINLIKKAGSGKSLNDEIKKIIDSDFIGYDFPRSMNAYARDLINKAPKECTIFSNGIQRILKHIGDQKSMGQTMNILCYFLGRCICIDKSSSVLDKIKNIIYNKLQNPNVTECDRIQIKTQYRTICVSYIRIHASSSDIVKEFLFKLLSDGELASIDRGYHRIYYGDDKPYKDKIPYCYLDTHDSDWSNSFYNLKNLITEEFNNIIDSEDVQEYLRNETYSIFKDKSSDKYSIPLKLQHLVFTLVSFVQSRLEIRKFKYLTQEQITFSLKVIDLVIDCGDRVLYELKQYFGMIKVDLELSHTSWNLIFDLYRLKWTPRSGWLKREIQEYFYYGRIESVAEHSLMAVYLAHLLLPESIIYDKTIIKDILTFHDVLEAYTGDFISHCMDDTQRQKSTGLSSKALDYIRNKDTYENLYGTKIFISTA